MSDAVPDGPDADLRGDILWDLALRRRAIAGDLAGLLSFDAATTCHEVLNTELLRSPPPGYARVSWTQLHNADVRVYARTAELCTEGCKALAGSLITEFENNFRLASVDLATRLMLNP